MSEITRTFIKEILTSRLGLFLAAINLCLSLHYLNSICWGKCSSGDVFNVSPFMQYYLLLNLPAAVISILIFNLLGIKENDYWWIKSAVELLTIFIMSVFWWLTGYFIMKIYSKLKEY